MIMKKLLLIMFCWPLLLTAQNGITLSGFTMSAGTVTFDISWKRPMPVAVWSDTVWVFVDYAVAGKMKRLPLLPGATFTATSVPGIGKVIEERGNNKGVWVVGNARSAGHFSATVQLLTSEANATGGCAYASNYRPAGKYNTPLNITFTGVPMYDLVLKHTSGNTYTIQSNSLFLLPSSYTLVSFTDATGAPGAIGCIPMTGSFDFSVPAMLAKNQEATFMIISRPSAQNNLIKYNWSAPDFDPSIQSGSTNKFSATAPGDAGTYLLTVTALAKGYCSITKTKTVTVNDCTTPVKQELKVSSTGFCEGDKGVLFAFDATDKDAKYRLYKDGAPTDSILRGTGSAATFTGHFDAGVYTVQVVDDGMFCGATMNGSHKIVKNTPPAISAHPKSQVFCESSAAATLTVTATKGSGSTLTYQWKEGTGTAVGANSDKYAGTISKSSDYWVVVTDENNCTATSDKATITVSGYVGGQIGTGAAVCGGGPGKIGW
jgi:hypothetical protein